MHVWTVAGTRHASLLFACSTFHLFSCFSFAFVSLRYIVFARKPKCISISVFCCVCASSWLQQWPCQCHGICMPVCVRDSQHWTILLIVVCTDLLCVCRRVTHYALQSGFSTTLTTPLSTPVFRRNPPQPVHIWSSSRTSCLWHSDSWLGYVQSDTLKEFSGILGILKLLSLQLPFDEREQKPVTWG